MSTPRPGPRELQAVGKADALEVLNQRLATAPAEELPVVLDAIERVSRRRQAEKDRDRQRFLATMNTAADILLSVGATASGIGIVVTTNDPEKVAFAAFLAGAGMFRVARQFVLGYFRIGGGGEEDEEDNP